jgi:hypothetical protein
MPANDTTETPVNPWKCSNCGNTPEASAPDLSGLLAKMRWF